MELDPRTIVATAAAIFVPVSFLLFLTWQTDRRERSRLWWAGAFFLFAIGAVLYLLRGSIPMFASVDLANGIILIGAGMGVAGARAFNGQTTSPVVVFAGAAIWFLGRQIPFFQESLTARVGGYAFLLVVYVLAVAGEYWRGRSDGIHARYVIVVTFLLLIGFYAVRQVLMVTGLATASDSMNAQNVWMAASLITPTVVAVANVLLIIGMAKERAEVEQRRIAETDDLTGLFNRRATLGRIASALKPGHCEPCNGAVLLFDLDYYKNNNDRYGHPAGDRVLREFAAVASLYLRQSDVFGRVGGEEFLAFLPGAGRDQAMAIAERIRSAFADHEIEIDGAPFAATVSIGIAISEGETADIDPLLIEADRALYAAKDSGRDRVQFFMPKAA